MILSQESQALQYSGTNTSKILSEIYKLFLRLLTLTQFTFSQNHFIIMVATGSDVGLAFALSIGAGMATCIGGLIIFFKKLVRLASPRSLAVALSLSAGVMIFISLVEIFGKSVESYMAGFTVMVNSSSSCGELGLEFDHKDNKTGIFHCLSCDTTCEGNAWLSTTGTFILGAAIIFALDFIVEKISPAAHEELQKDDIYRLQKINEDEASGQRNSTQSVNNVENGNTSQQQLFQASKDLNRTGILTAIAIGIHNIPEGVATYIGAITDIRVGASLAIGIALHNIPEGIAVATPVFFATRSRVKGFLWTFTSALAEPFGALLAWLIIGDGLNPTLEGVMFGIVCGMMTTISFKELLPNAFKYFPDGYTVIISLLAGFGITVLSLILFAYAGV